MRQPPQVALFERVHLVGLLRVVDVTARDAAGFA